MFINLKTHFESMDPVETLFVLFLQPTSRFSNHF